MSWFHIRLLLWFFCCLFFHFFLLHLLTNKFIKSEAKSELIFKWHSPGVCFFMILIKVWKQKCGLPLSFSQKLLLLQAVNVLTQHFSTGGSWPKNGSQICSHRVVDSSGKTMLNANYKKQITIQSCIVREEKQRIFNKKRKGFPFVMLTSKENSSNLQSSQIRHMPASTGCLSCLKTILKPRN